MPSPRAARRLGPSGVRADNSGVEATLRVAQLLDSGIEHHRAGRLAAAVAMYSRVVECVPESGEAWRLLGIVALQSGDGEAARRLLERALRLAPSDAAAHGALGGVDESEGHLAAAYDRYAAACALDPANPSAVAGLLRVAVTLGRTAEVRAIGEAAAERADAGAGLLRSVVALRLDAREYAAAADAALASLALEPHADAYANLAAAYLHLERTADAIDACNAALALEPAHVGAAINLGIAHKSGAELAAALAAFERAVDAGSDDAHMSLGTNLLLIGDYRAGWPHYGWPTAERRANVVARTLPLWDGSSAPGQRLLIWPEQGIGDTLQMVRFIRRARELVGDVTLACPPGTRDLLRTAAGVDACVATVDPLRIGEFDLWLPTIRLPVVFAVMPDALEPTPYLRADSQRVARFAPRLAAAPGLRVGLVWSGNPDFEWNAARSCGLAELEALAAVPGVTWFALQQGAPAAEVPRGGMQLVPINADVVDFADTAAIVAQLDLVITVDTSVAHLTGALGCPGWVVLGKRADWRWMQTGDVSPWYPTLRLFRQTEHGGWGPVIAQVGAALRELIARRTPESAALRATPATAGDDR